jgi:hypothetical protein
MRRKTSYPYRSGLSVSQSLQKIAKKRFGPLNDESSLQISMTALIKLHGSLFHRAEAGLLPLFEKGEGRGEFPEVRGHRRRRKSPLAPLFQRGEFSKKRDQRSSLYVSKSRLSLTGCARREPRTASNPAFAGFFMPVAGTAEGPVSKQKKPRRLARRLGLSHKEQ